MKKKKPKKKIPKVQPIALKPKTEEESEPPVHGVLPFRDLKKNLGCG